MTSNNVDSARFVQGLTLLWEHYGRDEWDGDDDVLGVLIRTILSQATSKSNTDRAFTTLMENFGGDWHEIAQADLANVVEAIRVGGLAKQKAPRIQAILNEVYAAHQDYTLESLADVEHQEALKTLLGFKGVGPKTARFTLMVALGGQSFPMDTHIFRILKIWGFLNGSESSAAAHLAMEAIVPAESAYAAHMTLVQHGRALCTARNPNCAQCPAKSWCPGI